MSTTPLGFDLHLDHDHHLSPADRELHAILTVTASAGQGQPVAGVRIRIRTVAPNRVLFCRQVHPAVRDLVGVPVDDQTVDHPTGPWGEERREYHLCLEVDGTDRPRGEDLLAARIDLVADGATRPPPVAALVHWTDDPVLSGRIDPRVAHFSGQEELSRLIADGCERYDSGDPSAAAGLLGRAVRLAAVAGDTRRLEELGLLVDIADPATGEVRIRDDLDRVDLANVAVRSSYTRHDTVVTDGGVRTCRCGRESSPDARYCERCGAELAVPGPVPT
ncbi:zinc ribbon domain-containing protein [Micromonospora sp. NPDC023956]|uniref:zinc ribbon domain-containing protein n=1 Tax=Micromonospora sp. NPDC023956 TaxID=3155722 RepID=UPI0033CE377B